MQTADRRGALALSRRVEAWKLLQGVLAKGAFPGLFAKLDKQTLVLEVLLIAAEREALVSSPRASFLSDSVSVFLTPIPKKV